MTTARVALFWIVIGGVVFAAFRFLPSFQFSQASPAAKPRDHRAVPAAIAPTVPASRREPPATAPRPALDDARRAAPAAPRDIVRCGNTYGQTACEGGRTIARPAASGFDSRPSEMLAALVAQGRVSDAGTTTITTSTQAVDNASVPDRSTSCAGLVAQIDAIDRAARQPRSMVEQNRLREDRQAARDRQARLHC